MPDLSGNSPLRFGQPVLALIKPGDTAYHQIYPLGGAASVKGRTWLLTVSITWHGTADAFVAINDGTTDFVLVDAKSGAVGDDPYLWQPEGVILPGTHLLKVKSSSANQITFAAALQFSTG
jgi:hypothetical protein